MTGYVVEEVDGEFVLPIADFVCVGVREDDWLIVRNDSGDEAALPAHDEETAQQLVARHARIERAVATSDSTLRVELDGNALIEILPMDEVEAWKVQGPGPVKVIAPAGGGEPAVFDETSETSIIHPDDPLPPDLEEAFECFGLPRPAEAFELRRTTGRTKSIELRAATGT